jgi:hypothetical protein
MKKRLKTLKEGIKKIISRSTSNILTKTRGARKTVKSGFVKKALPKATVSVASTPEATVKESKFYTGVQQQAKRVYEMPRDLPGSYGDCRIILQVRDPWWVHAYWEVNEPTINRLKRELGDGVYYNAKRVLRVYDVSHITFDGANAHRYFDIEINEHSTNWYIETAGPGRSWCVDIGLRLHDGRFVLIARSNTVYSPLDGPSWITDEEWMVPEEIFARLYGMGFGLGKSSPVGKAWQERIKKALFSGILASPGMSSMSSPVRAPGMPGARKFWLVVNTELIVYGATEPDAKVTVQGREIKLKPDGTFSLRFFLPDGKQVIPVHATSADGIDEREITPIVTKETK